MARYKDKRMNDMYNFMMTKAAHIGSSLFNADGSANRGTSSNDAFWNGYSNCRRPGITGPYYERGTLAHAAYMAGRKYRKLDTGVVKL